ncbi:MAG: hypothetical protein WCP16_06470 [Pseudanabaena sp. ELA645]|jgi:hypothetical protein
MIKTESLMKMGGVIALLATTLAVSDSATAINLTIGNASRNVNVGNDDGSTIGQSFINDPTSVTGVSILLNDWTFRVNERSGFSGFPLFSAATLNIYAGTGIGGELKGSSTDYTTAGSGSNSTATWTFAGGLSLIDNQTYTAAVISSATLSFGASDSALDPNIDRYANGFVTRSVAGDLTAIDTVFTANFSPAAATPVPFEFEGTGGVLVLGGGWLLRRHLKKRAKKD